MPNYGKHPSAQRILGRQGEIFCYEYFGGVAEANWKDPVSAVNADLHALASLICNPAPGPVAFNLSPFTIAETGARVINLIQATCPSVKVIEITEHMFEELTEQQYAEISRFSRHATELGYVIALDDAAPGGRALDPEFWKEARIQVLKMQIHDEDIERHCALAHKHGLRFVTERIETPDDFERALGFESDYFQGWHLGRPAPCIAPKIQHVELT